MAEVLGTTDLHTIGVGSSILPSATNERFFSLSYAESGVIGQHGRLWLSKFWFNSKPRNQNPLSTRGTCGIAASFVRQTICTSVNSMNLLVSQS